MPNSKATVSGDFGDLIRGADNAAKSIANLGLKLSGIAAAGKAFDTVTGAIGGTVNALGKIGLAASGIEAIGKSAVSMGSALLEGNAALEMTTISFKTLLGSASAADDMIKQLTQFAASTPFNLTGLEASTQKLLAFGYTSNQIIPLMTSLGDAISALGGTQDNLNSLVYVFGQMHQEAHINAGDIMQMVNQGIPALQMLADHYHKTTGEIQEMISKGLIPGTDAVNILSAAMEKQYGGMMAAQSSTFSGMISNLQDWFTSTTIILTKPLFEPAKKALQAFLNFVQSPAGVAVINKMALEIQKAVDSATAAFVRFEPQIRPTLTRLLGIANAIRLQMTPGIFSLIPLLFQFWQRIEPLALGFYKFYQAIQPINIALAAFRGYLTGGIQGALAALQTRFAMISGYVKIALNAALVEFQRFGPAVLNWVANLAIAIANKAVELGEALIHWVAPYAVRLIDALINLAGRVLSWIVSYAQAIAKQVLVWAEAIASWVIPAIPKVLSALVQLGLGVLAWVEQEAPIILSMMLSWADSVVGWVLPAIPRLLNTLGQLGITILAWIEREAPILINQLILWADIIAGWVIPAIPGVLIVLSQLGLAILSWVEREAPILLNAFLGWTEILASWIIPAIPGVIAALEQLGATIVNWAINRLPILLGQVIVGIGKGFGVNLRPVVNDVLVVFYSLVNSIQSTVLPAFQQMIGYLETYGMPLFNRLSNFIAGTVIPTFASLAAFAMTTLVPIFVTAADLLGLVFGPALTLIGSIIRNELLPALSDSWTYFDGKYMPTVRDMAAAFGEKLAGGIQSAVDKFKDALPGLEDFFKKIEPVVSKALELYKALSPISIALDVLKGLLTGGLPGAWKVLEDHIVEAGKVFGLDLQPAMNSITTTVLHDIIPALQSFWQFLTTQVLPNVIPAVQTIISKFIEFGQWVGTNIWPTLQSVFAWIVANIGPIFKSTSDTIGTTIIPALKNFFDWAGTKLWPKLQEVFAWVDKNVRPILEQAFDIIGNHIIPTVGDFIALVLNKVIPVLAGWWEIIATFLKPIFEEFFKILKENILPAIKDIWDWIRNKGIPAFSALADFVQTNVFPVLRTLADILGNTVGKAIGFVMDRIKNLIDFWNVVITIGDKLLHGDIGGAIGYAVDQLQKLIKGPDIVISGTGTGSGGDNAEGNAAQVRLQQYIMSHPGYNPAAAGNTHADGTRNAPGGLSLVGEKGMELIQFAGKLLLATHPMLLNLPKGAQVYNNRDTMAMLPSPASAQQISNMYSTNNANRSWDYSTQNSHNVSTTNQYFYGQQNNGQMPFGQQMRWYGAK